MVILGWFLKFRPLKTILIIIKSSLCVQETVTQTCLWCFSLTDALLMPGLRFLPRSFTLWLHSHTPLLPSNPPISSTLWGGEFNWFWVSEEHQSPDWVNQPFPAESEVTKRFKKEERNGYLYLPPGQTKFPNWNLITLQKPNQHLYECIHQQCCFIFMQNSGQRIFFITFVH